MNFYLDMSSSRAPVLNPEKYQVKVVFQVGRSGREEPPEWGQKHLKEKAWVEEPCKMV